MRSAGRFGGVAALLVVVLAVGWAVGAAVRPAFPTLGPTPPRNVTVPPDGPTLIPLTTRLDPGRPGEYDFRIDGAGTLTAPPRMTVARADATGLAHPVPVAHAGGTWRASLTPSAGGVHRVVVEIAPVGEPPRVLTADLDVPGPFEPVPLTPSRVAEVDGYQIRLDGDLLPGAVTQVFATVGRDGVPVTDLEPLDGAFGRLEALRAGDLAPARVHPAATTPAPTDRAGPGMAFRTEVPAPGTYRLFLDFRHGGVLRTAVFTVTAG